MFASACRSTWKPPERESERSVMETNDECAPETIWRNSVSAPVAANSTLKFHPLHKT